MQALSDLGLILLLYPYVVGTKLYTSRRHDGAIRMVTKALKTQHHMTTFI